MSEISGSSDCDETIGSVGSAALRTDVLITAQRRSLPSSPSPNAFLTPAFAAAVTSDGSISNCSPNFNPSLIRFTQSRLGRLTFFSSSSSNDSPDSNSSPSTDVTARKRLQQYLSLRSFSSSSRRSTTQNPMSPIENLQTLPLSVRSSPSYTIRKTPVKLEAVEKDILVFNGVSKSVPISSRIHQQHEFLNSFSSVNNNSINDNFKTEICHIWEECGLCRYGSRCQFAHGKEELRCSPYSSKLKTEYPFQPENSKQCSSAESGVYVNKAAPYIPTSMMESLQTSSDHTASSLPVIIQKTNSKPIIDAHDQLFFYSLTKSEEEEIQKVLYGPCRSCARLPVFIEICSESEQSL